MLFLPLCVIHLFHCTAGNHIGVRGVGHLMLAGREEKKYFLLFEVGKLSRRREEGKKLARWINFLEMVNMFLVKEDQRNFIRCFKSHHSCGAW